MKITRILLIASAICSSMFAFADDSGKTLEEQVKELKSRLDKHITIYGRAHVSVDHLDVGEYSEVNISSNSSRLGFKTERKFTDDITGMFQVEQEIFFDDAGTAFATRDTFVGLKGGWGMLRVGKFDTPFKRARGPANFFGDQLGDMRNITRTAAHGRYDERFRNGLHYRSPKLAGFVYDLQYSVERSNRTTQDGGPVNGLSTSLTYSNAGLKVALAYEAQYNGVRVPDAIRAAASYKVLPVLTVGAFYQNSEDAAGVEADVLGGGFSYQVVKNFYINAHYFVLDSELDDTDAGMYAVGAEYRVDRSLRFYGIYSAVDNKDNSAITPWSAARSASPAGVAGETASGISIGMRYDF